MKKFVLAAFTAAIMASTTGLAMAEKVRVGFAAEPYPPFTSQEASGKWVGWEVEFMEAVCAEAKLDCVITPVAWDGIIPALTANKIDMIIGSMSITAERLKTIDFSDKYYNTPASVAIAKGSGITADPASMKGKIVGVQGSTIHQVYASKYFKDAEIKEYQTQDEANQDLFAGRVDVVVADSLALASFLNSDQGKACCEIGGNVAHDEEVLGAGVGIGLRKGDAKKDVLNAAIKAIRENGTYDKISKNYFTFDIYGG